MTEIVDRPHPLPLSQFGRGEKNVDRENLKIDINCSRAVFLSIEKLCTTATELP
ncbi:hypothetical protein [Hydrococcus rivularis]|uniref:hypothetical protein n=1 Tax=Hydrococcus rivularis TaxID=1616834 RepID=UPI000B0D71DC|nr:hypothetical protein [Hydrococcus rivularis]